MEPTNIVIEKDSLPEQNDANLHLSGNEEEEKIDNCSKLDNHIVEFDKNKLDALINISSCDNLLSSTAAENCDLSEDDEFDLQKIKHEALYINYSSNFKSENSLDLDYDGSHLNVSNSFELNTNSFEHSDIFIHEEVFSETFEELELNPNAGVPLNVDLCKENTYDDLEDINFSSVLRDHNYIGQDINSIRSELSIKNLNDLRNYSNILSRFIADYEKSSELKTTETKILIEEMSENLNSFKGSIKNFNKNNINFENNELANKCLLNDNICTNEIITPYSEVEIESLILSENCSEPLEYNNNLLETDDSKNNLCQNAVVENDSIVEKEDSIHLINQISRFGVHLVDSCKKFNTSPNKNVKDFLGEKLLECKKMFNLNTNTVSVQTDYSGKIYSEKRLKKINDNEKYRLLIDSSTSSFSDEENMSNSSTSSESNGRINTDIESNSSYNGIDLSQYIEKPEMEKTKIDLNDLNTVTDTAENDKDFNEQHNNSLDLNKEIINPVSNGVNFEHISEEKDEFEEREINRLLDFKSLASKKTSLIQYVYNDVEKSTNAAKSKSEKLLQMLEYSKIDDLSDGSCTDIEDNLTTEKEFLVKRNEDLKQSLLETSSSDSDTCSERITLEKENNDSNTSLVLKFLETYEIENENDGANNEIYNPLGYENTSNHDRDADADTNMEINNNKNNEQNKIEDSPEKNSIFDKSFVKKPTKEKSFESLLTEDERRRKYLKYTEELISLSSEESEIEELKTDSEQHSRILRPMMRQDQLASETKVAQKEENNRILRLKNKENILKKAYKEHKIDRSNMKELILDYDLKSKKFIKVHPDLYKHLKQHQIEGIKFMYDACYGSVNFTNEHPGSGCILAHCMGLGKTLQLISLLHTVICNKELKTSRILVLCPKSTVMNWADEIQRWLAPLNTKNIKIFTFSDTSDVKNKLSILKEWASSGQAGFRDSGCLLIGYEAFRTLVSYHTYRKRNSNLTQSDLDVIQKTVKETLLQPGADLVVCDEGHIIKNRKAAISQAVTEISTTRRIVLTGTPIQNNLKEYYSMVNFIKPSFLGTEKEFANLYANPIRYGQHKDSSKRDIKIMKQRSFVLHKKLSSFVQRREAALLKTFLPHKFEYVLFIPLSKVQSQLYEIFLESVSKRDDSKGRSLLTDYTCLRKIWTHPKVLENAWLNATMLKQKKEKRNTNLIIQSEDEEPDDVYDSQTGLMSVTSDWWRSHLTKQDLESIIPSNKLQAMFEILKMCEENREKCLIFSAFVAVLNVVEYFMQLINNNNYSTSNEGLGIEKFKGPWVNGKDYYRLDGKTPKTLRHEMVKSFNNPNNSRARVFLISSKAGGQGINLIGANRVLILDTSWNPSNDQQNIFRIFRLGQTRNCYIYRLISLGTMEEKVYSRSVTKQAMSFRVVDEHQIDRHYSMAELAELYTLTYYGERPVPFLPQDSILANLLRNHSNLVYKYHEHDSLLENKIEQELSEQEKEDAWLAYERDTNNAAITGGILPQFGRFDVFANQGYIPPGEYTTSNLAEMAFNQRGIAQHPTQSPFLSNYQFPSNDYYIDSLYKMSQNPQNYSSSMLGLDSLNTQCASNNNARIASSTGLISNASNTLNFCNTMTPFGNTTQNIPNEINSLNQPHFGTSTFSPSVLNHFDHSSLMHNLKKTLESYSNKNNTGSALRVQKAQTAAIQNNNPFPPSFLTNDSSGLPGNTTAIDAIPTSVIMKNDLLLKQFNDQIKSATDSNNRYNSINKSNIMRPILKTQKSDSLNCPTTDNNISLVKAKKKKNNDMKNLQSVPNPNYPALVRPEEAAIAYKPNISSNNTYISGLKSNITEPKDKNEENSVIAKSSGILLIDNQANSLLNNSNEQTTAVDNIPILSNTPVNKTSAVTKPVNSLTVNYVNKPHIELTNNSFISTTLKNTEIQTSGNKAQNPSKSSQFAITVETEQNPSPTGNMGESNFRIRNFPKSSQPKQITNNEKVNKLIHNNEKTNFTSNINQNIVITKVQDTKRNLANAKKAPDLIQTGKNSIRSTTLSNLIKGTDKSIVNKFLNSDLSITPARNRISNTATGNQTQHIPEIENITSSPTQSDPKKRTAASLPHSTNFTNESELHKRLKLTGPKQRFVYKTQNNY